MAIPHSALMVELLMSADRVITAAQSATVDVAPDVWSPAVVVGHLSQVDETVWLPRLDTMVAALGDHPPAFTWWEPDPVATAATFADATVDETSALLLASRTRLLHRLRDVSEEQWRATASHDIFGVLDVEGLMIQVLGHDEDHRASLLLGSSSD